MSDPAARGRPWYERYGAFQCPAHASPESDAEALPAALPTVVDAHVHLFPEPAFRAIWRWQDAHGWKIHYRLLSDQICSFLFSRGVSSIVALQYPHAPGFAGYMNDYMHDLCVRDSRIIGLATVFPGEPDARTILRDAFAKGLRGVKLHCHVQCFAPDAPEMHEIYEECARAGRPVVMHAGREPAVPAYRCDPYEICSAARVEAVLRDHPQLKLCIPHMGADEYAGFERLLDKYDNLWLDTAGAIGVFPEPAGRRLMEARPDRIMYGSDFPMFPSPWNYELKGIVSLGLSSEAEAQILGGTCQALFAAPNDADAGHETPRAS